MNTLAIIPSRYASTRFPGKPLVKINGKSMIQRVYEQVQKAELVSDSIVATDDQRIVDHVLAFGGKAMMTKTEHQSGTDRCAEVVNRLPGFDLAVNVQGDEPFIAPDQINQVIQLFDDHKNIEIGTLAKKISSEEDLFNPNVVKVVFAKNRKALYFSRATLPFLRNIPEGDWLKSGAFHKHIGIYGFKCDTLLALTQLPRGTYEQTELLEQLRWLENGFVIQVGITEKETIGIDTPEDLARLKIME